MTREDAIKTLKELRRETNDTWYEEVYNIAINALEADRKTESQTCDDCIWSVCNYNKVDWDADTPQTDCGWK